MGDDVHEESTVQIRCNNCDEEVYVCDKCGKSILADSENGYVYCNGLTHLCEHCATAK